MEESVMPVEYLVVEAYPEFGPLRNVKSKKLEKRWESLQEALDELGSQGWELSETVYGGGGSQKQHVEAYIFERDS
jgi:hypothetical protein